MLRGVHWDLPIVYTLSVAACGGRIYLHTNYTKNCMEKNYFLTTYKLSTKSESVSEKKILHDDFCFGFGPLVRSTS